MYTKSDSKVDDVIEEDDEDMRETF